MFLHMAGLTEASFPKHFYDALVMGRVVYVRFGDNKRVGGLFVFDSIGEALNVFPSIQGAIYTSDHVFYDL